MNNGKTRAGLLAVVAGYLLYISYDLFRGRGETDTTMTPAARWLFISLFVVSSVLILIYAWRVWQQSRKGNDGPSSREDENSLK